MHDGRAFNESDVKSITKYAKSTKKNDVNTIGKFGLGFKSVYSVTDEPEIHSGGFDFKITEFIRPYPVAHNEIPASYTTLFILYFKTEKKERIYYKLGHKFNNLELKTVLFLSNLKSICWEIAEEDQNFYKRSGAYLKEDSIDKKTGFKLVTCLSDTSSVPDQWFVFSRGSKNDTFIEIAFKYDEEKKQIVPANNTDLVVLFPTEKETGLNFVINGNFHMWLPNLEFLGEDTYFLNSEPDVTVTDPGNSIGVITVGAYNHYNNSIALFYFDNNRYNINNNLQLLER